MFLFTEIPRRLILGKRASGIKVFSEGKLMLSAFLSIHVPLIELVLDLVFAASNGLSGFP